MKVYKSYKIHEILTSKNIDSRLDHYAEVLMMLVEIKKLIDNDPENDIGSKYDSDDEISVDTDDDESIGSDGDSIKACDIKLVEVDTDSDEE